MSIWDESSLPPPEGERPADQPATPGEVVSGGTAAAADGAAGGSDGSSGGSDGAAGGSGGSGGSGDGTSGEPDEPEHERWWSQRIAGLPAWLLLALGLAIWIAVIAALVLPGGDEPDLAVDSADTPAVAATAAPPTTSAPSTNTPLTAPTTTTSTTTPATTAATPAATEPPATTGTTAGTPPTTAPTATTATTTTSPPATTTTTTTTATTTTTTTTTTTAPPATTTTTAPATTTTTTTTTTAAPVAVPAEPVISEATTVVGADGQSITATPRRDSCSSGPDCLVVKFTIDGWATQPTRWVCEFSSGARYQFKFSSGGVDPACSTVDIPDSIVIEIEGLRTEPITISRG